MTTHEAAKVILGEKDFNHLYIDLDLSVGEIVREAAVRCFTEQRNDQFAAAIREWLISNRG